jgi:hypothetical protein
MTEDLECYSYLWDGSAPGWVLLKSPYLDCGHCVFNEQNSVLLHIEREQLNTQICQRMKESGCQVIDSIPTTGPIRVKPEN